ncbi:hypothetical protein DL770_001430 [Monosporascus sp. CRB-9-2]|nr:hypothetical protein DL770_001430 [Monosporascus sp. CRB-9-2]
MAGAKLPTPEETAWQLAHPEDSLTRSLIAASFICASLATIFVALRIWSKRLLHGRFRLEVADWLCVAAWVLFIPLEVAQYLATQYGLGRHVVFVTNPRKLQILLLISVNCYAVVLALLKLSVLSLYRTLFKQAVWFYRTTWAVCFVVVSLGVWVVLASDLQCVPIKATWDPFVQATCINYGLSGLLAYIVNIVTDLVILSMPVPLVLNLNVSLQRKRLLIFTFAMGGSACIASLIQLKYITNLGSTADPSWDHAPIGIVSSVEIMVGFLAVSTATYRPIYQYLVKGQKGSTGSARSRETDHAAVDDSPYKAPTKSSHSPHVTVENRLLTENSSNPTQVPHRGITVTDRIELVRHVNRSGSWVRLIDPHDDPVRADG